MTLRTTDQLFRARNETLVDLKDSIASGEPKRKLVDDCTDLCELETEISKRFCPTMEAKRERLIVMYLAIGEVLRRSGVGSMASFTELGNITQRDCR